MIASPSALALARLQSEARQIVTDLQLCIEKPSLCDVAWIILRQHRRLTARPVPAMGDGDRPGGDAA